MAHSKPTIYDVASHAGVSITTVSRFLNNPQKVAGATREKITAAMDALSFLPKADAMARARKDFHRVGVLTPFSTEPSFVQRQRGIASALNNGDYELITYSVESLEQLGGYLSMLPVSRRIDGLIILSLPVTDEDIERFTRNHIPVVTVESSTPTASSVVIDNARGGQMAADYLIDCGYQSFGFLGEGGEPAYSLHATDIRYKSFRKRLEEGNYALKKEHTCFYPFGLDHGLKSIEALLTRPDRPEVIFAHSDLEAATVVKVAHKLGLSIPENLGVLGFDNIDLADFMEISTINQSLDESGRTAASLLIEDMKNPGRTVRNIHLNLEIMARKTTRVVKNKGDFL